MTRGHTAAAGVVRRASLLVDRVAPPQPGVSVLIYHRVGGSSGSAVDLDVALFRAHLAHLREHCRVTSLDEAVRGLSREDPSARNTVVLTFDDGTVDFVDVVVPLLVEYHIPATVYVATRFVDEAREFPWGAQPLSWAALRDATSTGLVSVGSHTHSHHLLDRVSVADAAADLDRSIDSIATAIGTAPIHFAYPKAVPGTHEVARVISDRFRTAALARSRVNRVGRTDLQRLWRTPIQSGDTGALFAHKVAAGMRVEGALRALTGRLRYRSAAT